jgi:hypothetical protein
MSRLFCPIGRLLTTATVLAILGIGPAARAQDDDEDEAPAQAAQMNGVFMVNNAQFDQWVFGNVGAVNAGVARNKLDSFLSLNVEDLERTCSLTPVQKKKLMLAGHGDIKRFFDRVEDMRKKFDKVKNDQNQFGLMWQDIQTLQTAFQAGVFGEESIYAKAIKSTLSEDQAVKHEQVAHDRLMYRYRARVDLAMELLNNSVGFTDEQRQRLVTVLEEGTRPPRRLGQNDYYAVLYLLASLPEAKVKPIFDDIQYRSLRRQLDQARGLGMWLKQNGFVPDEEPGQKAGAPKPAVGGRVMIMPAVPLAPAVRVKRGE